VSRLEVQRGKIKGLKTPRLATPRPALMTTKGQTPVNPFSGNKIVVKRASGPLQDYIRDREREDLVGEDPFFVALRVIQEEQEKEAGLAAALRIGGGALGRIGTTVGSKGIARQGAKMQLAAGQRYSAAAARHSAKATAGGKGGYLHMGKADKLTQMAQGQRSAARNTVRGYTKPRPRPPVTTAPVTTAPAAAEGAKKGLFSTKNKLIGGAVVGTGVLGTGYAGVKGVQAANRQNATQAAQGYNTGIR